MTVDPDLYLDKRQASWMDYEVLGQIKYDPLSKLVRVDDSLNDVIEVLHVRKSPRLAAAKAE